MNQHIILKNLQKPRKISIEEDIDWIGDSFGFKICLDSVFNGENINNNSLIFQNVIIGIAKNGFISTQNLSDELDLSVQRINYHLRSFIDSGFLYRDKKLIYLREGSVKSAIEEIRKDANRIFDNLSEIAEEIDNALGFKNRR
jgi:predicted transcriptional regulator